MSVSGIASAAFAVCGGSTCGCSACTAMRAPADFTVSPIRPADAVQRRSDSGAPSDADVSVADAPSLFDTTDRVELSAAASDAEMSDEERAEVEKLQQRDAEVRQHEAAHQAAAGPHAQGGPQFEYETGPDGRRYAVGGEVQIDTSEVSGDPEATIAKMQQVRAAALAPANPSAQDRAVAAAAAATIQKARSEQASASGERSDAAATAATPGEPSTVGPAASEPGRQVRAQGRHGVPDRAGARGRYAQGAVALAALVDLAA